MRIVKDWIDPSIDLDPYSDQPWMYAPALSSWFAISIGEKYHSHVHVDVEAVDDVQEDQHHHHHGDAELGAYDASYKGENPPANRSSVLGWKSGRSTHGGNTRSP